MHSFLKVFRYIVFALFIISNSVIASVAVWNHSLAQAVGWDSQIDVYLIFLGCFGLAHIFTIIFVELAWRHGITGRVWFECIWLGLFLLMYLGGAAAVTVIAPSRMCESHLRVTINDACISTHLLLAFVWIMTGTLLTYFSLLVIASLLHIKHNPRIFNCYVHKFPWGEFRHSIPNVPVSPSLPNFLKKMPSIVAPKPQRPPPVAIYNHHAGLEAEYEIESYSTPVFNTRPLPALSPAPPVPVIHNSRDIPQPMDFVIPSFYPQYIQSTLVPKAEVVQTEPRSQPIRPSQQRQLKIHEPPLDPPPLNNWPRPSTSALPLTPSNSKYATTTPAALVNVTRNFSSPPAAVPPTFHTSPSRPRPSGPRRRSDGETRVAVPDLSNISSRQAAR